MFDWLPTHMEDMLDHYMDQESMTSLEGQRGVSNFTQIVKTLGYADLDSFLADNSGALEAMLEWIGKRNDPDWRDKMLPHLTPAPRTE